MFDWLNLDSDVLKLVSHLSWLMRTAQHDKEFRERLAKAMVGIHRHCSNYEAANEAISVMIQDTERYWESSGRVLSQMRVGPDIQ